MMRALGGLLGRPWFIAVLAAAVTLLVLAVQRWRPDGDARCAATGPLVVLGGKDDSTMRSSVIGAWRGPDGERAEFRDLPLSVEMEHSELVATARSRSCGADVYVVDTPWIPEFASAGYIDPVGVPEDELRAVMPKILDTGRFDGRLWAVPLNTDAPLLVYRKDLVRDVPADWAALEAEARRVMAVPGTGLSGGYMLQLSDDEGFVVNVLEIVRAHGGDISVAGDGEVSLDRDAVLAALRDLAGAMPEEAPAISRAALDSGEEEGRKAFQDGEVALLRNWPAFYARIANSGRLDPERFGAVPFPLPGVLGGQSLVVAAGLPDDRARAARDLIGYAVGRGPQELLFTCGGYAPVRADVYASGAAGCAWAGTRNKPVQLHADPRTIKQAVDAARPRPSLVHYFAFGRVLRKGLHARLECLVERPACAAEESPEAFLDRLTRDLERAARGRAG